MLLILSSMFFKERLGTLNNKRELLMQCKQLYGNPSCYFLSNHTTFLLWPSAVLQIISWTRKNSLEAVRNVRGEALGTESIRLRSYNVFAVRAVSYSITTCTSIGKKGERGGGGGVRERKRKTLTGPDTHKGTFLGVFPIYFASRQSIWHFDQSCLIKIYETSFAV